MAQVGEQANSSGVFASNAGKEENRSIGSSQKGVSDQKKVQGEGRC